MTPKKLWRSHRFVPLPQLTGNEVLRAGVPLQQAAQFQASSAEGFQQGMDRGYREGYESGMRSGLEAGVAQGVADGRRTGEEQARRETLERFADIATPIESMRQSLERLQADYEGALRKEVVELVAKVAREVIRNELAAQPAQLLTLVDEALSTLPHSREQGIEVYLNAADLERIQQLDAKRIERWNLVADANLQPGECRIKAGEREADAGCQQRLDAVMEQVSSQLLPHDEPTEHAA